MSSETDIAWAAGLFEGEGCFGTSVVRGRCYPQAQLKIHDLDVLTRFHAIVGVGRIHKRKRPEIAHHKQMYSWHASAREDVQKVALLLGPLLGVRRQDQIMRMWEHSDDITRPWFMGNKWASPLHIGVRPWSTEV